MATRKKGKKNKWQTVPLTDLIPEVPGGMPPMPNWADEIDDDHDIYSSRKPLEPVVLPTAPRAARGPGIDEENIPKSPPYVAYVFNLPYDVLEEDLAEFFAEMNVTNMRLPKDSTKLKGYGYVDFEDRQSLINALQLSNTTIKGRRVRIEVSNNDDRRGRMGRDYGRRDNYDDPERSATDWRSGPRDEPSSAENDRYRNRGGFDRGNRRDDRDSAPMDMKPGAWREGRTPLPDLPERRGFRSDDRDRDFSRFSDRGSRDDGDRGGSGGGSSFGPRRNYGGDRDRDRDRNFGGERDRESSWGNRASTRPPAAEDAAPAEPRTRTKLVLQPRSKPIHLQPTGDEPLKEEKEYEEGSEHGEAPEAATSPDTAAEASAAPAPASAPVPAANIFGAAKPVDTAARERQIEERLEKNYAESKSKGEEGERKAPSKEGVWGKRNGEGRGENEKDKPRPSWRSEEDRGRNSDRPSSRWQGSSRPEGRNDSHGPPPSRPIASRGAQKPGESRGPPERERKNRDRDDSVPNMPRATTAPSPNFAASNKYIMLHDAEDSDILYD